jgi:hypothetical protein
MHTQAAADVLRGRRWLCYDRIGQQTKMKGDYYLKPYAQIGIMPLLIAECEAAKL